MLALRDLQARLRRRAARREREPAARGADRCPISRGSTSIATPRARSRSRRCALASRRRKRSSARNSSRLAAAKFWHAHPPREAWLGGWGDAFGNFLGADARCARGRVSRRRRAVRVGAGAGGECAPTCPRSMPPRSRRCRAEQHPRLCFTSHPSVTLLRLRYPADAITDAVRAGDEAAMAAIDLGSGPVHLLVHRAAGEIVAERMAPPRLGASCGPCSRARRWARCWPGRRHAWTPPRCSRHRFARGQLAAAAVCREGTPCDA